MSLTRLLRFIRTRKRVFIPVGGLLGLILIALVAWIYVLPQYRPALRPGEVYGIDVSEHQKPLDWTKVANDDIAFAYIKASEGSSYQDARFAIHWRGAQRAGLRVGAYHYFSLCSLGKTQAENFLRVVPQNSSMLPPIIDLEFSPFCKRQPNQADVIAQVDHFLELVSKETGKQPIIYVGDHFDSTYHIKQHYQAHTYWQLRYLRRPADPRDRIWQVGYFFNVNGAPGNVDLNVGQIKDL